MTASAPDPAPDLPAPESAPDSAPDSALEPAASRAAHENLTRAASFAALATALGLLACLCARLAQSPQLGTDTLIYHLPFALQWAQEGFGSGLELPFHEIGIEHGPLLAPTIHYVLIKLCGGVELAWVVQPLAFLGVLWVFFRSLRLLGLGRSPAAGLCALLAVYFPPFFNDLQLAGSDMLLLFGLALTLQGVLLTRRSARAGLKLVVIGTALQLLTKGTALMAIVALAPLLIPALREWWRGREEPRGRALDLGGSALLLAIGGWTYLRNLFSYGNPLWPTDLNLGPFKVLEGRFDPGPLRDHGWSPDAIRTLLLEGEGPHGISLALSLPLWAGFVVGLLLALRIYSSERTQNPWRGYPRLAVTILFPLLAVAVHFLFVPYWEEPRYLFPTYYALWLSLGSALALGIRTRRALAPWIAGGLPLLFFGLTLLSALGPAGLWFWPALLLAPLGLLPRLRRRRALQAILLVGVLSGPLWFPGAQATQRERWAQNYQSYYPDHGEAWSLVAASKPKTIAYAGTQLTLPLYGPDLRHTLLYVPVGPDDHPRRFSLEGRPEECTPSWFWIFAASAQARRTNLDSAAWLGRLEAAQVDLLFLANDPWRGGIQAELQLVAAFPKRFQLAYSSEKVRIYRLLPR